MCCSVTSADYSQDDSDLTYLDVEEGVCEAVSVAGAEAVVESWPGRIREIQCYRPPELCDTPSDHCNGMAVDLMISDETGVSAQPFVERVTTYFF